MDALKWAELSGLLLLVFFVGSVGGYLLGLQVTFSSLGFPGIHKQLHGLYGRIVFLFDAIVLDMRYMLSFRGQVRVVG